MRFRAARHAETILIFRPAPKPEKAQSGAAACTPKNGQSSAPEPHGTDALFQAALSQSPYRPLFSAPRRLEQLAEKQRGK